MGRQSPRRHPCQVHTAARRSGHKAVAAAIKGAKWALWKNAADLTTGQQAKLAHIEQTNQPLFRAYLLNQQLRQIFATPDGTDSSQDRVDLLDAWLDWATHSGLTPFTDLAWRIRRYWREDIINTLTYRLSNGLIESTNTKIRLLTRIAFGFKNPAALIAMVRLHLCGYDLPRPGRT